jgi:nicotinamidase-related amidase
LAPANHDLTGPNCVHLCVDMQAMFAEPTEWHAPWMSAVLPAIAELVGQQPERTLFTRFIPPATPQDAHGAWRHYYERWAMMTRERLPAAMIELVPALARHVPPAGVLDKSVYSPWLGTGLHRRLRAKGVDTLVVTGGESDVCVLATVLGAIDHGYRVVLPTDGVYSSADATHDAILSVYRSRFGMQLVDCTVQDILDDWKD